MKRKGVLISVGIAVSLAVLSGGASPAQDKQDKYTLMVPGRACVL